MDLAVGLTKELNFLFGQALKWGLKPILCVCGIMEYLSGVGDFG